MVYQLAGSPKVAESTTTPAATPNGKPTVTPVLSQLQQGWNLLTRTIGGVTRTLLVYGDNIPPSFLIDSGVPTTINVADVNNGATWVLQGNIYDDSFGRMFFRKNFSLSDKKYFTPVFDASNNMVELDFSMVIKDFAGNATVYTLKLTVNATAPLQGDLGRKNLPDITPSVTVIALIDWTIPPPDKSKVSSGYSTS